MANTNPTNLISLDAFRIQKDLIAGDLSFEEIAQKFGITDADVMAYAVELAEQYDDSMDGDFDSAMASAGWGVDEDYISDNDYYDSFE